jgi:hypothetical protein
MLDVRDVKAGKQTYFPAFAGVAKPWAKQTEIHEQGNWEIAAYATAAG